MILLPFWKSEAQNQPHWTKVRVSAGLLLLETLGIESISLPLSPPRSLRHSLARWPFLNSFQYFATVPTPPTIYSDPPSTCYEDPSDYVGPIRATSPDP